MGKKEKEHRKKVTKRNDEIKSIQKKLQRAQQDRIMQMIEREKAEGKFDNPVLDPTLDLGQGPQI